MRRIPLLFPFSIALFFTLFGTVFFPQIRLLTFSPFLAIVYHRSSFLNALWIALLSGLCLDLCSSELQLGANALNLCLVTVLVYRFKRQFFEEKPLSLFLFTALISIASSLSYLFLASIFQKALPFSIQSLTVDLILMPLADGLYAFLCFSCPMKLYSTTRRA